jgi:hypothetical protein|tara:strand:+ start:1427 stop:1837 length:411 start_codon:yes stop_codon:yes gene_type:complete
MADKKVTALSALSSITSDDLFLVVNNPQGTPTSYKVSAKNMFKSVPANTAIKGLFTTTANTIIAGNQANVSANATFSSKVTVSGDKKFLITTKSTNPGNSNAVAQSITAGTIFYSNTHLYITTDSNTIKRIALSTF